MTKIAASDKSVRDWTVKAIYNVDKDTIEITMKLGQMLCADRYVFRRQDWPKGNNPSFNHEWNEMDFLRRIMNVNDGSDAMSQRERLAESARKAILKCFDFEVAENVQES